MIMQMSNAKFSTGSRSPPPAPPIRIAHRHHPHHRYSASATTGELMIPTDLTYFAPQHKRYSLSAGPVDGAPHPPTITTPMAKPPEKRSPVNKSVQQINSEEEASVLSRYPFHGNRALPSSRGATGGAEEEEGARERAQGVKRWSLIDVNNNRVECEPSEIDLMLQPATEGRSSQRTMIMAQQQQQQKKLPGRAKRQLTSMRSHSGHNKIHYKSPPMKRYSNVYDYAYMSDPSLNAIHEDSDSQ